MGKRKQTEQILKKLFDNEVSDTPKWNSIRILDPVKVVLAQLCTSYVSNGTAATINYYRL